MKKKLLLFLGGYLLFNILVSVYMFKVYGQEKNNCIDVQVLPVNPLVRNDFKLIGDLSLNKRSSIGIGVRYQFDETSDPYNTGVSYVDKSTGFTVNYRQFLSKNKLCNGIYLLASNRVTSSKGIYGKTNYDRLVLYNAFKVGLGIGAGYKHCLFNTLLIGIEVNYYKRIFYTYTVGDNDGYYVGRDPIRDLNLDLSIGIRI